MFLFLLTSTSLTHERQTSQSVNIYKHIVCYIKITVLIEDLLKMAWWCWVECASVACVICITFEWYICSTWCVQLLLKRRNLILTLMRLRFYYDVNMMFFESFFILFSPHFTWPWNTLELIMLGWSLCTRVLQCIYNMPFVHAGKMFGYNFYRKTFFFSVCGFLTFVVYPVCQLPKSELRCHRKKRGYRCLHSLEFRICALIFHCSLLL